MDKKTEVLLLGEVTNDLKTLLTENNIEFNTDLSKKSYSAIIVRGGIPVQEDLIDSLPSLEFIVSAGIGVDNIDISFATKRNVLVANCPFPSAVSTAEHSLALLLTATKKIAKADREIKTGTWDRGTNHTIELVNKKVAVIGLGRIGSHVASLYRAIGLEVVGYDPYIHDYNLLTRGIRIARSIQEAVAGANFISLHVSKCSETTGLLTREHIMSLDKINGIINTCRGGVVSEDLVHDLVQKGLLGFYATDVFENEPVSKNKLISLDNVICTPHIAANTNEAQLRIAKDVVKQLVEVFTQGVAPSYQIL